MSMMRSDRKPPLAARSPMRLRPRRVLRSTTSTVQTPPGSIAKSQLPEPCWEVEEAEIRPEYQTISWELRTLAKKVQSEFGNSNDVGSNSIDVLSSVPVFERGRFYEEYSARRNERLKRKKGDDDKKKSYDLGVKVVGSMAKRRDSKKMEGLRQSVPCTPVTDRRENPSRYMLRSTTRKENQKPPLPLISDKCVSLGRSTRVLRK